MMKPILTLAPLAAILLAVCAPAAAAPAPQGITVSAADLDLRSDGGQRVLARRIERAARAVCKAPVLASLPRTIRKERGCVCSAQARAEALMQTLAAARDPAPGRGW